MRIAIGMMIDFLNQEKLFVMKRLLSILAATTLFIACSKNPITGRNQLAILNEAELQQMAAQEYQTFLSQNRVVATNASRDAEMVRRIGNRLVTAINQYYKQQGLSAELSNYAWEFNLVNDDQVNAWAMPGGKTVVYTGLLPVTQNEAALAVVMGHEIAHSLAKHGNERMSQVMVAQGIGAVGGILTSRNERVSSIFNNVYGPAAQLGVLLPNSRNQELEADKYGLIFTAMAGYNPQEAIGLWQRMAQAANGQKPPEFMSTHPSEETRIQRLQKFMPEALKYYKPVR